MTLSVDEVNIIRAHTKEGQLHSSLAAFRSEHFVDEDTDDATIIQRLVSSPAALRNLITALQNQPVTEQLPSRVEGQFLCDDLGQFRRQISSDSKLAAPLVKLILKQSDDESVWASVYNLIDRAGSAQPRTPSPSAPTIIRFSQTPWTHNSSSFVDTSELRSQIDRHLKYEHLPSLRLDVPDLDQACFGQIPELDRLATAIFCQCRKGNQPLYKDGTGWTHWPSSAKEELILDWLKECTLLFSKLAPGSVLHSRQIYEGPARQTDDDPIRNWARFLVLGELKSDKAKDNNGDAWLDLAMYVREVFSAQVRRFVLGFTLCGSIMRLWRFDHLGNTGSTSFDVNEDGIRFVQAMLGYIMMNDEQLGLDPTVGKLDSMQFIKIIRNGQSEKLVLTEVLRKQATIVGRATTCWRAYREGDTEKKPLIVKDSWQYTARPEEGELIKEASESGVRQIARYYYHDTVQVGGKDDDVIANVRQDQMKTCGRTSFRQRSLNNSDASNPDDLGESQSLSRKRSFSSMENPSPLTRSRSSQRSKDDEVTLRNRVHRRVITCSAGKPIERASSLVAVLNGLIGAIDGHESLFHAGILHHDISTGNIMLTEAEDSGFLIDFDLAIRLCNGKASGAPNKTGTKVFMAIDALRGEHDTFMHDLESFFWVLFWIGIHWNGKDKERIKSDYEKWNYLSMKELAEFKVAKVVDYGYFQKEVKDNLSPCCKPLLDCILEMREVIFPDGRQRTSEDERVYALMRTVLEKAKEDLTTARRQCD
ncbi:MAG: hypothetical protein M1825_000200 [Sarcosagium campestre]|nr:MAG: hypothetical protein M1825_000200 [Sarcosagium campestre]